MALPPPIAAPNRPRRLIVGWLVILALFLLILSSVFGAYFHHADTDASPVAELERAELQIGLMLSMQHALGQSATTSESLTQSMTGGLSDIQDTLPKTGRDSLSYRVAIQFESQGKVDPAELKRLREAAGDDDPFVRLYTAAKLDPATARDLASKIGLARNIDRLATIHAFEKSGDKAARQRLTSPDKAILIGVVSVGFMLVVVAGIGAWIWFFVHRANGGFPLRGQLPWCPSPADADANAIRGALLLLGFLIAGVVSSDLGAGGQFLPQGSSHFTVSAIVVLVVINLQYLRIGGTQRFNLADMGFRRETFRRDVGYGLAGFAMEIPLSIGMAVAGQTIFRNFPTPTHPIAQELASNPSSFLIAGILVMGAVVAPFWEEIFFRGFVFGGLNAIWRKPWAAGFASSFMFAMMHPQGVPLWFALATVGAVSCVLVYHTRSIVPSIVMHMSHNATVLVVGLLMSRH